ncbi:hypothetical protein AB0M46_11705 [Dactylosporangium sp. NPDC051485]|uniref:hypothetical protein n=1 Tax=Dactylosporangium sp. NPDC051485 TaxID=3154846 RepID=UPI00342134D7
MVSVDPPAGGASPGLIHGRARQATPSLYFEADIGALITAAGQLPRPLGAATYHALIGLPAVTGMRVEAAIGLDRDDLNTDHERSWWPCASPGVHGAGSVDSTDTASYIDAIVNDRSYIRTRLRT